MRGVTKVGLQRSVPRGDALTHGLTTEDSQASGGIEAASQSHKLRALLGGSVDIHGPTDFYGWALAGPSGIKRVEVSADDGVTWHSAQLVDNNSPYVWTVWKYRFAPKAAGDFMMRVRATDGSGVAQPPADPQTGSGMSGQARIALEVTRARIRPCEELD